MNIYLFLHRDPFQSNVEMIKYLKCKIYSVIVQSMVDAMYEYNHENILISSSSE